MSEMSEYRGGTVIEREAGKVLEAERTLDKDYYHPSLERER